MLSVTPASKRSCTENKQLSIKAMHSFGSNENKQKAAESPSRAAYRCSLRSCCHQCPLELSPSWTQLPATRHYDPTESCVLRDFTEIHELQKKKYMGNSFPIIFQLLKLVLQAGFLPVPHRALQARKKLPSLVVFKEQQPVSIPFIAAGALWAFLSSFPWVFLHHVLPCELTAHTAQWQCEFMQP